MAQYDILPIYKAAYDFFTHMMNTVHRFPRDYKFSLGEKIQNASIEIVLDIYRANSAYDKTPYIKDLLEKVQILYLLLRVSHDMKIMSAENYAKIIVMLDDISKQAQGWLKNNKALNKKTNEKVPEPAHSTD